MMGVSKFYDKKPIIADISLSYFYGAKIGVLGLNGSGKTTLLRIMAGEDKAFNGEVNLSQGYSVGYLEQEPKLDDALTVREVVEQGLQEVVDLLKEYDQINESFSNPMSDDEMDKLIQRQGEVQDRLDAHDAWELDAKLEMAMDALRCPPGDTPVKVLSGGERRRVALCRLLLKKPEILLLDEPTNDLDANTMRALEEALENFVGCAVIMTHDRWFLDRIATHILVFEGDSRAAWFEGNYSDYEADRKARLGHDADQFHRIRYRNLTRG